jgi:hypothetical protein
LLREVSDMGSAEDRVAEIVAERGKPNAKRSQVSPNKALPESEPVEAHVIDDEPKHAGGRPSDYTDEMCAIAHLSIPEGGTLDAIANVCGVHRATVSRWMDAHEEFCDAVKAIRCICDDRVERSLFRKATGYNVSQQVYDKRSGKIQSLEISVPGDTAACIFFLKNRRPQMWRDKHDVAMTGADGGPIVYADATADQLQAYALEALATVEAAERICAQSSGAHGETSADSDGESLLQAQAASQPADGL